MFKWLKRNYISFYIVINFTIVFGLYYLIEETRDVRDGRDRITIIYFTFSTIMVLLSSIGFGKCVQWITERYEALKRVEEE